VQGGARGPRLSCGAGRLTEFATDAAHLADQRLDLDLRRLVDDLHRDLIELQEDR
jgi:hypothetical protein